jgi:hypothetical protein
MFDNLTFEVLQPFFSNLDIATASSVASISSFGKQIQEWIVSRKDKGESQNIEDYLEWLRRHDHQQLVEQLEANMASFQKFFDQLNRSLAQELAKLDANAQARHDAEFSLDIDLRKVDVKLVGFSSSIFQQKPLWVTVPVEGRVTIVNRNRSVLTPSKGFMGLNHDRGEYRLTLSSMSQNEIPRGGASRTLCFNSAGPIDWNQDVECVPTYLEMHFDQLSRPQTYSYCNGLFVAMVDERP